MFYFLESSRFRVTFTYMHLLRVKDYSCLGIGKSK